MQVFFETSNPEDGHLRELAERRSRFVLRRVNWLIAQATVKLSDARSSRGIDKRCQVQIDSLGAGSIVVVSKSGDWRVALDDALTRAVRCLWRVWRRVHEAATRRSRLLITGR